MITIVDYGLGNLGSIANMLRRLGVDCEIVSEPSRIERSSKIILPGVGAFDAAMKRISDGGFVEVLQRKALVERVPFLGICLGMQLLTSESEEGNLPGLGFISGRTVKFRFSDEEMKVPHMGWNSITVVRETEITKGMSFEELRFYFVHSYHIVCVHDNDVSAQTKYGYDFTSIVSAGNIHGAQFHPEKSHRFGMKLLQNFAEI